MDVSPRSAAVSHAIAGAQLGLIGAWLDGKDTQPASALAQKLHAVTSALLSVA
jgi:hypothetical protein